MAPTLKLLKSNHGSEINPQFNKLPILITKAPNDEKRSMVNAACMASLAILHYDMLTVNEDVRVFGPQAARVRLVAFFVSRHDLLKS